MHKATPLARAVCGRIEALAGYLRDPVLWHSPHRAPDEGLIVLHRLQLLKICRISVMIIHCANYWCQVHMQEHHRQT